MSTTVATSEIGVSNSHFLHVGYVTWIIILFMRLTYNDERRQSSTTSILPMPRFLCSSANGCAKGNQNSGEHGKSQLPQHQLVSLPFAHLKNDINAEKAAVEYKLKFRAVVSHTLRFILIGLQGSQLGLSSTLKLSSNFALGLVQGQLGHHVQMMLLESGRLHHVGSLWSLIVLKI